MPNIPAAIKEMLDQAPELREIIDRALAEGETVNFVVEKCGKVCYGHEATALAAATAMHGKTGDSYDAYECSLCEAWHIGHAR